MPSDPEATRERCRYPYLCGEEWCDCNLSPEDIRIMDENVRKLFPEDFILPEDVTNG